jgi:hypothetical protein
MSQFNSDALGRSYSCLHYSGDSFLGWFDLWFKLIVPFIAEPKFELLKIKIYSHLFLSLSERVELISFYEEATA